MTHPAPDTPPETPPDTDRNADGAAALASLEDRRNFARPAQTLTLYSDRIERIEGGQLTGRIALDQVKKLRMSVEMAGGDTQVVCRVVSGSSEIVFGSRAMTGPARWSNNALDFRALILALHKALLPRKGEIGFVEGQTLGFRVIMFGIGLLMVSAGLGFAGYMALVRESAMLALAALPFAVIGGYLAWMFRLGVPLPYSPEGLIARFEAPSKAESD